MRKTRLGCTILEGHDAADLPLVSENAEILDNEIKKVGKGTNENKIEMMQLIKIKRNIAIAVAGWTKVEEFWQYNITDTDVTVDTIVDVNIHLADLDKARDIKTANQSNAGKVTIYADDKPLSNIKCDLKIVREAK